MKVCKYNFPICCWF